MLVHARDIEVRLAVEKRVAVVQLLREQIGVLRRIAQTQSAKALDAREFGKRQVGAEQFLGQRQKETAHANVRAARGAARALAVKTAGGSAVCAAANIATKFRFQVVILPQHRAARVHLR